MLPAGFEPSTLGLGGFFPFSPTPQSSSTLKICTPTKLIIANFLRLISTLGRHGETYFRSLLPVFELQPKLFFQF